MRNEEKEHCMVLNHLRLCGWLLFVNRYMAVIRMFDGIIMQSYDKDCLIMTVFSHHVTIEIVVFLYKIHGLQCTFNCRDVCGTI